MATGGGTAIEIRDLTNRFGQTAVHENLDLDVRRGEILGVVGGSGTGKSVLLRSIIGLQRPAAGRIRVDGIDVYDAEAANRDALEKRWGVLFQDGALFSSLTIAENVSTPIREHLDLPGRLVEDIVSLKLRLVDLGGADGKKYPSELSGGMRKRAGLARALALDPEFLFLDEPTAGLDPIRAAEFDALLRDLTDTLGLTVFLVTHDVDTLVTICDRIAVLADKHVIVAAPLAEVMAFDHPWVQEYFSGPRGRRSVAAGGG